MRFKIIVLIVVLFVLAGWFYWYELRPSQIVKECDNLAYRAAGGNSMNLNPNSYNRAIYADSYAKCLKTNGIR